MKHFPSFPPASPTCRPRDRHEASDLDRATSRSTKRSGRSKAWDMLRVIGRGGPALCNIAVTNACNATCDFCNFARGKIEKSKLRWIDADKFDRALAILH